MLVWAILWGLYLSFVNVGQVFYGFGWKSILLEAGFYAMFLGSQRSCRRNSLFGCSLALFFRIMFGAGLIKCAAIPAWPGFVLLGLPL